MPHEFQFFFESLIWNQTPICTCLFYVCFQCIQKLSQFIQNELQRVSHVLFNSFMLPILDKINQFLYTFKDNNLKKLFKQKCQINNWEFIGSMCKLKCKNSSFRHSFYYLFQMLDWNATKKLTLYILNKLFSFTFRHILTNKAVKDGGMLDLSIRNRQGKTVLHYLGPIFFYKIDWLKRLRFKSWIRLSQ